MKIVILDAYTTNPGDLSWDWLNKYGQYEAFDFTKPEEIIDRAYDCQVVFTNKTPLVKATLSALPNLKYIGLLSTGFNIVDIDHAAKLGIPVANIPSYSKAAVAQLTFAHILELCNAVGLHDRAVKEGKWSANRDFCFWETHLTELYDKTIGLIGFGKIGQAVAKIALAMEMKVLAHTPNPKGWEGVENFRFVSLDELLDKSDIVSMHCPLNPSTEEMADKFFFDKMKDSAFFINTSRGGVVREADLAVALNQGKIAGAGLDVLSQEPPKPDNPLLTCKNCYITPHIAWAGFETR
ncbi:MAG: D-2-hydroxyacid dehydrogenase, partial [Clostridiales bacterium]|nr:D-2-hydroxyacid dehydrogenase [Clostridiales bacterium]